MHAVLAAQLHALHLGASAAYAGVPMAVGGVPGVMGSSLPQAGAHPGREASHGSVEHSGMQQLDPSLLASHELLSRLQMGAGGSGMLPPSAVLPSSAIPLAAHPQQQQPQDQRPPAPGRRRGGSGSSRRNEEKVRCTVYISDISDTVTEAQLAAFFQDCGQLVDCRVCGDPNSSMRFAFIEFMQEDSAQQVRRPPRCQQSCPTSLQLVVGHQCFARAHRIFISG